MKETRMTSSTGGQKGQKSERHDLIVWPAIRELAEVCGMGADKYDDDNWRKGYSWRLSYGALLRHLSAFWEGEDNDPESGFSHLAHVMWHAMVLWKFSHGPQYRQFDDRPDLPELDHIVDFLDQMGNSNPLREVDWTTIDKLAGAGTD